MAAQQRVATSAAATATPQVPRPLLVQASAPSPAASQEAALGGSSQASAVGAGVAVGAALCRRRGRRRRTAVVARADGPERSKAGAPDVAVEESAGEVAAKADGQPHGQKQGLLSEKWEHALHGREGDVWTEPQIFAEIVGPLNGGTGDEQIGSLNFEMVSKATDGDFLLFLPGIDFAGVFAATQFRSLASDDRELWRCWAGPEDRTPFALMVDSVERFLRQRVADGRRVVLLGESFGGLLALAVALRMGNKLGGLALVNPATSFGRTAWPLLGRALAAISAGEPLPPPSEKTDAEVLAQMNERFQKTPYAYLGSMALVGTSVDGSQLGRLFSKVTTSMMRSNVGLEGTNPVLQGFLTYPEEIAKLLPPETIRFRLRAWLRDGCEAVGSELRAVSPKRSPLPPTLLVLSEDDRVLGSTSEGERLKPLLETRCGRQLLQVVQLPGAGHAPLDKRFDLAELLQKSPIGNPPPRRKDYVGEYELPSLETIEAGSKTIEGIAEIVSPVFVSRDPETGARMLGLEGVPDPTELGRPVVFVGNHQLLALDLGPMVREFLVVKGYAPRGLAHPINFPDVLADAAARMRALQKKAPELLDFLGLPFEVRAATRAFLGAVQALLADEPQEKGGAPEDQHKSADDTTIEENGSGEAFGVNGSFVKWGAVPVTPRNFFKLLQRKEAVLLFPGGVPEACHGPGQKYQLFWPEKTDFVRVAAKFNALVVPFGSIGSADNLEFVPPEVAPLLPFPKAPRLDLVSEDGLMPVSESLTQIPDFQPCLPKLPPAGATTAGVGDRFYYSFGSPVDLSSLDPSDREACDTVYAQLRKDVEGEISWLLEARTRDPYRDFLKRQVFERLANLDKLPKEIGAGKLKGRFVRSYGQRAPTFDL